MKNTILTISLLLIGACSNDTTSPEQTGDDIAARTNLQVDGAHAMHNTVAHAPRMTDISEFTNVFARKLSLTGNAITNILTCTNIRGSLSYGTDSRGNTIVIDDVTYDNVLGLEPVSNNVSSLLTYDLHGKYTEFKTKLFLNSSKATVIVKAYVDGEEVFSSGVYKSAMEPQEILLQLNDAEKLELLVSPYGYCSNDVVVFISPELK